MVSFDQKVSWDLDPTGILRSPSPSGPLVKEAAFSKKQRLPFPGLVSWEKGLCSNFAIYSKGIWDFSAPIPVSSRERWIGAATRPRLGVGGGGESEPDGHRAGSRCFLLVQQAACQICEFTHCLLKHSHW